MRLENFIAAVAGREAGMVKVNGTTIRDEAVLAFGGANDSDSEVEGGLYAMEEFTAVEWVTMQTGQQVFAF